MEELKTCPFCGGEAKLRTSVEDRTPVAWVACDTCGARTKMQADGDYNGRNVFTAVERWNRRVENE